MLAKLRQVLARLGSRAADAPSDVAPIDYKGYRIRPEPYRTHDHYQTAGTIEKVTPEGVRAHRFVRADTYHSRDDAIAFTITKAKQIIDQQGDRIFS
jgi:hypothetical protein